MKKMTCNKYTKICGDLDRQVWKIMIVGHYVIRTVHCSFLVCVSQCVGMSSVALNDMGEKFFHLFVPIAYFCLFVPSSGEMSVCCSETVTAWSRILLEKLTFSQLVKKLHALYVTQRFVTTFTKAFHLYLS